MSVDLQLSTVEAKEGNFALLDLTLKQQSFSSSSGEKRDTELLDNESLDIFDKDLHSLYDDQKFTKPLFSAQFKNFSPEIKSSKVMMLSKKFTSQLTQSDLSSEEKQIPAFSLRVFESADQGLEEQLSENGQWVHDAKKNLILGGHQQSSKEVHKESQLSQLNHRVTHSKSLHKKKNEDRSTRPQSGDFQYEEMEQRIYSYFKEEGVEFMSVDDYLYQSSPFAKMKKLSTVKLDLTKSPLRRNRANTICI